jgi:translation elongation factor P/translation initiation factor 5A
MKKLSKRIIAIVLAIMTITSTFVATTMTAQAANYTTNYNSYSAPSSSDYAYWNGSKMVKASGTTTSEIKWMQAALNYCIKYKGLDASYLDVDGSFGPASKKTTLAFQKKYGLTQDGSFGKNTISKMKSVLNSNSATTTNSASGKITTAQIQSVLNKYNYKSNMYWTVVSSKTYGNYTLCAASSKGSTYMATKYKAGTKTSSGTYMSYNYNNSWQCMGFANFVMAQVTGSDPKNLKNGWKKLTSVSSLQVGDIIRSNSGHSSIVLSVDSKGNCTFAECWGSEDCVIKVGGGFNGNSCKTLSSIKSKYGLNYVYRYEG